MIEKCWTIKLLINIKVFKNLTFFQVLSLWFDVQRTWSHLESIFIGSEDIRKQLPVDSQRFDDIDAEFKKLMKKMSKTPNVVRVRETDQSYPINFLTKMLFLLSIEQRCVPNLYTAMFQNSKLKINFSILSCWHYNVKQVKNINFLRFIAIQFLCDFWSIFKRFRFHFDAIFMQFLCNLNAISMRLLKLNIDLKT
jgi:hypothetical protein